MYGDTGAWELNQICKCGQIVTIELIYRILSPKKKVVPFIFQVFLIDSGSIFQEKIIGAAGLLFFKN